MKISRFTCSVKKTCYFFYRKETKKMKTLSTKASKQKILSLLLLAGLWSIMLIIVLLAAKSTWAKNLNSPYWAPAIITIGIIFFITYFIFTVRALFYRQHGYDNQYIYYYKSTSYFNILKLIINTLFNKEMYQDKIAFKDIKKCEIGWYNQTFRIHSFGSEVAHPIYFKINEQMVIKTDLTSNNEHIIELANLLKSHVKNFKDPYHLVLAMNDRSITVYEYIERIIHNKIIKPNLYK